MAQGSKDFRLFFVRGFDAHDDGCGIHFCCIFYNMFTVMRGTRRPHAPTSLNLTCQPALPPTPLISSLTFKATTIPSRTASLLPIVSHRPRDQRLDTPAAVAEEIPSGVLSLHLIPPRASHHQNLTMPPRKALPRRSDVSTARFALMEDDTTTTTTSNSTTAAATTAAHPASSSPAPGSVVEVSTTPSDKKLDADGRDSITIEVSPSHFPSPSCSTGLRTGEDEGSAADPAWKDLTLPKSIITRLAKGVLPPNTQIQANAILALSNSTTLFINYLASHANENTINAGKKTISPADVFKAIDETEFSFLRAPLEAEFAKFNAIQTEKRTSYRQKVRAKKSDDPDSSMADTSHAEDTTTSSTAPRAKKARVDPSPEEEDAETEDDVAVEEDDDEEDDEVEEDEEEEDAAASGDETQDALEEKEGREDGDEALDGDESD
ncbi:hypothetical protein G7046_g9405 [Stylonectria norvegica]|nr:hypothetical protein G7046_g9405 [Stylonectria norvegica]